VHKESALPLLPKFFAVALLALLALLTTETAARDVHVDPAVGNDLMGDGSVEAPLRSIGRALEMAPIEVTEWNVHLAPGVYSEASGEVFPLSLVLGDGRRSVRLVGPDPDSGGVAIFVSGAEVPSYVEIVGSDVPVADDPEGAVPEESLDKTVGEPTVIDVGQVLFDGAEAALSIVGGAQQSIEVRVHDCTFVNQKTHSLEIVAGDQGSAVVDVRNTTFSGHAVTALDLATKESSFLDLNVQGNRFIGAPLAGAFPLRTGVSVFLDADSTVTGKIENNFIRDMGDGILVATSELWTLPGSLDLVVQGNFIAGSIEPAARALENAIYLSLNSHHAYNLKFYHNTLSGGHHGVRFEGLTPDWIFDQCDRMTFEFIGNAVYGFEGGDFSIEGDPAFGQGLALPPPVSDVDFLLECFVIEGNGLDRTALAHLGSGNFELRAEDLEFSPDGYRPRSPDSQLIDRSPLSIFSTDSFDLVGECRLVDGNADNEYLPDVGAFEAPGPALCGAPEFLRGDCDGNTRVEITDAINLLGFLFLGTFTPTCRDACDTNDDGNVDLSDPLYILTFLFIGGIDPIPQPYPDSGPDLTVDSLDFCLPAVQPAE
jgi:hypothetical protein